MRNLTKLPLESVRLTPIYNNILSCILHEIRSLFILRYRHEDKIFYDEHKELSDESNSPG